MTGTTPDHILALTLGRYSGYSLTALDYITGSFLASKSAVSDHLPLIGSFTLLGGSGTYPTPYQRSVQDSRPLMLNLQNMVQCDKIRLWPTNWLWRQSDKEPFDTKVPSDLLQESARASRAAD